MVIIHYFTSITLRKALLSERDGNSFSSQTSSVVISILRKALLSERDGNNKKEGGVFTPSFDNLGRHYSLKEMETEPISQIRSFISS